MEQTNTRVYKETAKKLKEICDNRKDKLNPANTSADVLHELVIKLHNKECK